MNGEDTGFATVVTEFTVRVTRENLAAVTAEELDGRGRFIGFKRGSDHVWIFFFFFFCGLEIKIKKRKGRKGWEGLEEEEAVVVGVASSSLGLVLMVSYL